MSDSTLDTGLCAIICGMCLCIWLVESIKRRQVSSLRGQAHVNMGKLFPDFCWDQSLTGSDRSLMIQA